MFFCSGVFGQPLRTYIKVTYARDYGIIYNGVNEISMILLYFLQPSLLSFFHSSCFLPSFLTPFLPSYLSISYNIFFFLFHHMLQIFTVIMNNFNIYCTVLYRIALCCIVLYNQATTVIMNVCAVTWAWLAYPSAQLKI